MSKWLQQFRMPVGILLFYLFIITPLFSPIASNLSIPKMADLLNHLAIIIQAKVALTEGQFPLRVAPLEFDGYRYPLFQFYASTAYLLPALIYKWFTPDNPFIAYKFSMGIGFLLGAVYMQRLAYWLFQSRPAALLAGVIYITSPYYLIVLHNFGDLTEAMALGLLPIAIDYTLKSYYYPQRLYNFLLAMVVWYALLTIHVVTFVYTVCFAGLLLIFLTIKNFNHINNLLKVGFMFIFVAILAMWYLAPLGLFANYFSLAGTYKHSAEFSDFAPTLANLLTINGGVGTAYNQGNIPTPIHAAIGWPILFGVIIYVYATLCRFRILSQRANYLAPFLGVLFMLVFFAVWSPFNFWKWLPHSLMVGQYSWRFLSQLIWIGALISAWSFLWCFNNKVDIRHLLCFTFIAVLSTVTWMPTFDKATVPLKTILSKPHLVFSSTAYVLDTNANTQFIDAIDKMSLDKLIIGNAMALDTVYFLTNRLLSYAYKPQVEISGIVAEKQLPKNLTFIVTINDKIIATKLLGKDPFKITIPLSKAVQQYKNSNMMSLAFHVEENYKQKQDTIFKAHHKKIIQITPTKLALSGFIDPNNTLDVEKIKKDCHQDRTTTICNIQVPANIKHLELPILFYPHLLRIKVNGNHVSYSCMKNLNFPLVMITPYPGQMNNITIEFVGLEWANLISQIGWILYLLVCVIVAGRYIKSHILPLRERTGHGRID